jgi:hypothetical protein
MCVTSPEGSAATVAGLGVTVVGWRPVPAGVRSLPRPAVREAARTLPIEKARIAALVT